MCGHPHRRHRAWCTVTSFVTSSVGIYGFKRHQKWRLVIQRLCYNRTPLSDILMLRMDIDLLHPHVAGYWRNRFPVSSQYVAQMCKKNPFNIMSWQAQIMAHFQRTHLINVHFHIPSRFSLTTFTFFPKDGNSPLKATRCHWVFLVPIDKDNENPVYLQ